MAFGIAAVLQNLRGLTLCHEAETVEFLAADGAFLALARVSGGELTCIKRFFEV